MFCKIALCLFKSPQQGCKAFLNIPVVIYFPGPFSRKKSLQATTGHFILLTKQVHHITLCITIAPQSYVGQVLRTGGGENKKN